MLSTAIGLPPCRALPRETRQREKLRPRPATYAMAAARYRDVVSPCTTAPGSARPARRRPQEGKVAAVIGAEDFPHIEPGIAAPRRRGGRAARGGATLQFGLLDQEIDAPRSDRE